MAQLLDRKLHAAIDKLNDKQKKIVLSITQAFTEENDEEMLSLLEDENFIAEMNRRYDASTKADGMLVSLENVEKKALSRIAKIKKAS